MKLFGTDGIRGLANRPPLDPETLVTLGSVLGRLVRERASGSGRGVLLGNDGRASAEMIHAALVAGLLSEGVDASDAGLVTTPALAHETRLGGFAAGIMISASHNPADDNGIKIFGSDGRKIADTLEERIELEMQQPPLERKNERPGRALRLQLGATRYRSFLRETFADLSLADVKILVDCAHGGGSTIAPEVLAELGAEVVACNNTPDGTNINDGCGALHPGTIAEEVQDHGCDLGLCLDGDGDRAIFVDAAGNVVHGDALLTLLAVALSEQDELPGERVAVTVMSNLGLKKRLEASGIGVVETPVGDRSVMAAMTEHGLSLGGENSGHVIFGDEHNFTGDGLYTCLKLLGLMRRGGKSLAELASCFTPFPQLLVNVPVTEKPKLMSLPQVVAARRTVEERLAGEGRVVLRYSGTENLCRVMVEARTEGLVQEMVDLLVNAVRDSVGAR